MSLVMGDTGALTDTSLPGLQLIARSAWARIEIPSSIRRERYSCASMQATLAAISMRTCIAGAISWMRFWTSPRQEGRCSDEQKDTPRDRHRA
jgi:hypothetical protein